MTGRCLALALATVMLLPAAGAQEVYRYTESQAGSNTYALGYPVPKPVDSLTPVDGFRSYQSLHARHQSLAMEHDYIRGRRIGGTIKGRDIYAYVVSDGDDVTVDGNPEPSFLINGGIHAREWQSPEVVTGIIERFAERRADKGLYAYLVENARLVAIPVLNVDGFLQTQRFPERVLVGQDPSDPDNPRDGRMRRKNLRNADEDLFTFGDHLNGVDLNRNNPPFAPSAAASGNPTSLIFHGNGSRTEPETRALAEAIVLAGRDRLRLFTDFHSFSALFYEIFTANSRRNQISSLLVTRAIRTLQDLGTFHTRDSSGNIGSTDEHFAYDIEIPAWTHEIEPRFLQGGRQYGGFGAEHDGFILPESEIARVRNEIADTYAMLFYAQSGPPSISEVKVLDGAGNIVWGGEWRKDGAGSRSFVTTAGGVLVAGAEYRLWIAFNKPMRHRDEQGAVTDYPGMNAELEPSIALDGLDQEIAIVPGKGRWLDEPGAAGDPGYRRYRDDAYMAPLEIPAAIDPGPGAALTLNVAAEDLAEASLDADPSTAADWGGGHWVRYESGNGSEGDVGGTDATLRIPVAKEAPVGVSLGVDRPGAPEGARVTLTLKRASTATAIEIGLLAERVTGASDPVTATLFETDVTFYPGGAASEAVSFTMPDDLAVSAGEPDEVRVTATIQDGNAAFTGPASLVVGVEDNDSPGRRVLSILHRHPYTLPPDVSPLPPGLSEGERLADALELAQSVSRPVTINLADGGLYSLNVPRGDPDTAFPAITGNVTIEGRDTLIARHFGDMAAEEAFRLFRVTPGGRLTLRGLVLERGRLSGNQAGGAVLNEGSLETERVIFRDNSANRAGALSNAGTGELKLSSFVGNSSNAGGGAVFNTGELALAGTTLSGNVTDGRGGAILNQGDLAVRESTLTGNDSPEGSDWFNAGRVEIVGSVLASAGSCFESFSAATVSGGYNLDADATCGLGSATDLAPEDPLLGPLNPDALHVPEADSPLVDAIPETGPECLPRDPSGVPRPFAAPHPVTGPPAAACEIGAAERGLAVQRGMWFNPERSGHGIDLQQAGNQLIVTWFTYDTDGTPVWYQASGPFNATFWEADLYRYRFDRSENGATGEVVGSASLDFESETEAAFAWDLSPIGQGSGSEPFEPLEFGAGAPNFDTTGHWAAADGSSWGLSVDVQGDILVATVYYYDADGNPRWVQGSGKAGLHSLLDVASFTGFCPGCDLQAYPFTMTPAGSLELRFSTRLFGGIETGFAYPGTAGGSWQREAELGSLSDPVP